MNADFPNPAKTVQHVPTRQEVTTANVHPAYSGKNCNTGQNMIR